MLDFRSLHLKKISLKDLCVGLTVQDLRCLTDEMVDAMLALISDAVDADVTFQPVDPEAYDEYASSTQDISLAWTLGHVIVHATASSEEAAARASTLARGVEVTGRSRYEVPWQTVTTIAQTRHRLEENRHMRHALLNAWPDDPHLDVTYTADHPNAKPRNAIAMFVAGLAHDDAHLGQIVEIMRQARENR